MHNALDRDITFVAIPVKTDSPAGKKNNIISYPNLQLSSPYYFCKLLQLYV